MFTPSSTKVFLLVVAGAVLTWAFLAAYFGGPKSSISVVFSDWCYDHPIIALLAGVFLGHSLWALPAR